MRVTRSFDPAQDRELAERQMGVLRQPHKQSWPFDYGILAACVQGVSPLFDFYSKSPISVMIIVRSCNLHEFKYTPCNIIMVISPKK